MESKLSYLNGIPSGYFIILACLIGVYFTLYNRRKAEFRSAADKFRAALLGEFHGLIPTNGYWSQAEYPRFKKSVPVVKQVAKEFQPYIPWHSRKKFDIAVSSFYTLCENMTWEKAAVDALYNKSVEVTQKEECSNRFHDLLSYSN